MNRLDDILGPANWWDDYIPQENSVICRLTIRLPDGTTLTKCDAGGYAGMSDSGDDDKSGFSDAFKRAAVKFGIGRYLYRDGVPRFVREHAHHAATSGEPHRAGPAPTAWAHGPSPAGRPGPDGHGTPPQTGRPCSPGSSIRKSRWVPGCSGSSATGGKARTCRMVQWNAEQVLREETSKPAW